MYDGGRKCKFEKKYQPTFSGAFADFRKATISFNLPAFPSVCLSVCPHGTTELPLADFLK
jgi:hypothetical protein